MMGDYNQNQRDVHRIGKMDIQMRIKLRILNTYLRVRVIRRSG